MLLMTLKEKKLLERFMEKNCKKKKKNQKEFRVEKIIKRKCDNYMLNGKDTIILLTVGLIKKAEYKWVNIFKNWNLYEQLWKLN